MDVIQIDDVIPRPYQDHLEAEIASDKMAWFFRSESGRRTQVGTSYSGFSNTPFHAKEPAPASPPMTALLLPVLYYFCDQAHVPFSSLLRIRLGLFPRTMVDVPHHNPHVDFYQPHMTAVYYVNDSDGDTVIFNETFDQVNQEQSLAYTREGKFTVAKRIAPRKGRMIGFDGRYYHASMHPMKNESRIAIAFTFV